MKTYMHLCENIVYKKCMFDDKYIIYGVKKTDTKNIIIRRDIRKDKATKGYIV